MYMGDSMDTLRPAHTHAISHIHCPPILPSLLCARPTSLTKKRTATEPSAIELSRDNGHVTDSEPYMEANRANWNDRSRLHRGSAYYDLPGFLAGASSLYPLEQMEVGAVAGKRLLHLQCHL